MSSKNRKWAIARKAWAPLMGVLVVGGLCYSLRLEGSTVPGQGNAQDRAISWDDTPGSQPAPASGPGRRITFGKIPKAEYPIAPPVLVNPFDDEGDAYRRRTGATGPIPLPQINGGGTVAAVACSFAVDCDDGNPCTFDRCDIAPGGGELDGTCANDPIEDESALIDEILGRCDDGVFCNGAERCTGAAVFHCLGTCVGGPNNGQPCAKDAANNDNCPLGVCGTYLCVGGLNNGNSCSYDSDCTTTLGTCSNPGNPCSGGTPLCNEITNACQASCASDADCKDPTATATTDGCTLDYCCVAGSYTQRTCNATGAGNNAGQLCDANIPCPGPGCPCRGTAPSCGNAVSVPCPNGAADNGLCIRGNPCGASGECTNRFCVGGGPSFNLQPCVTSADCGTGGGAGTCSDGSLCQGGRCCSTGSCERRPYATCAGAIGSRKWFAGDTGRVDGSGTTCPGGVSCPKYGAGIGELGKLTVVAGPTTLSPFNNLMSGAPLRKLGDDYDFSPSPALITLTDLRFVGGVDNATNSRTSFEFYDENGAFIQDIFFITQVNVIAVQNVQFDVNNTPFDIPNKGYVVAHVLQPFAGDINSPGELYWLATDTVDHGANDAANLYVDTDLAGAPAVTANFLKACVGGVRKGAPCGNDSHCPGSTCGSVPGILAFELEGPAQLVPPTGACCNGAGVCTTELQWECIAGGRLFLGAGQACDQCSDDSPNVGANCTVNTDCSFCVGGVNDGLPCPANPCTGGACLGTCVPACGQGACCDPATGNCAIVMGPGSCSGTWLGFGSSCVPNCCDQPLASYTGRDRCQDAIVHNIILPSPGQEVTITITGDNTPASSLQHCVGGTNPGAVCTSNAQCTGGGVCTNDDDCNPPSVPGSDLGWFEAFSIDGCAYMRIDTCCTDTDPSTPTTKEPKIPSYRILYDNCPCGQSIFVKRDPNNPNDPADARGAPYCNEDNAWGTWGPLVAGTYYYPILSFLGADFGKYQLHITAKACPEAACCHNICTSVSGPACTTNADCSGEEKCVKGVCQEICGKDADCSAGQCQSTCELLNILDCQAIGGAFRGPPNQGTATTFCTGACANGSCCTGAGVCEDEFVEGTLGMTIDNCDTLNGVYVGGFACFGGTCGSGSRTGLSCQLDSQCPGCGVGNCCLGDAQSIAQPTPCPICDLFGSDHCQSFDDATAINGADLTLPGGARNADNFIPSGTTVNSVCTWGVYQAGTPQGNRTDCATQVSDNFTVTIWNSDPTTGLPSTVKGSSTVTGANVNKAVVTPTTYENLFQVRVWSFKLNLDTPIAGLTPGTQYWLDINNETDIPAIQNPNCLWNQMGTDFVYDDYSAAGAAPGYGLGSARTGDYAWCVDVSIAPTTAPSRACCDCQGGCTLQTKRACDNVINSWHVDDLACGPGVCTGGSPKEDNCTNVRDGLLGNAAVGEGVYLWDNNCTSTDGPNPIPDELGSASMSHDIWLRFVSDCPADSEVSFGTCPSGTAQGGGIDTFIAVYHDNNAPNSCVCPNAGNHTSLLWPDGLGNDEGCTGVLIGGGGVVQTDSADATDNIDPGMCFMVRLGGFAGQGSEIGQGTVVIDCVTVGGMNDPLLKGTDDICSNSANACAVNSDCPGGFCRNKNRFITAVVPATASSHGIKISITNLDANSVATPANYNGTVRWAGAPTIGVNDGISPPFNASQLQCTFASSNWSAVGQVHFYGQTIVPLSTYSASSCNPEASCSAGLTLGTAKFGDVVAPVNTVNFQDVNSIVAKFQGTPAGPSKTRTKLTNSLVNPANPINFQEVSACVSAFQSKAFKTVVTTPPPTCP